MKRLTSLFAAISLVAGGCLLCAGLFATSLFGFPQPIQDYLDQHSMLQHFDLPSGLQLIEYDRYPAVAGFGQREGLNIRAVYQLSDEQADEIERRHVKNGWSHLPVSAETRHKIQPYVDPSPLELSTGMYFCRTAGDNVLHARQTYPCGAVERLNDVIFGAFDTETNRLYLQVGSGY